MGGHRMARNHGVGHRPARRSDAPLDRRLVATIHRRPLRRSRLPNRSRSKSSHIRHHQARHADDLSALGTLLLRTESVDRADPSQRRRLRPRTARRLRELLCRRHGHGDHRSASNDRDGRPERTHPPFRNHLGARSAQRGPPHFSPPELRVRSRQARCGPTCPTVRASHRAARAIHRVTPWARSAKPSV